jgi:hypothetical protein
MSNTHLDSLLLRLSNERIALAKAKKKSDIALRAVWVRQIENEIAREIATYPPEQAMTDDELLAALEA